MSHQPHDTQGNILRGYRHLAHVEYRFFEIDDRDAVRALLARTASHVSTDEHWGDPSQIDVRLNVAFTYRGLEKLGRHAHFASADYEDFRVGMAARAGDQLGDSGASDPQRWEPPLREGADVLFTIYRRDSDAGQAAAGALRAQLDHAGLRELYVQQAEQLPGRREQFGFADGFSQPVVQSSPGARRRDPRGEGVLEPPSLWRLRLRPRWRALALGEFLLGHRDEDDVIPAREDRWLRNGTFMVWRKLRQHVDRFDDYLGRAGGYGGAQREWLAAKLVGRWRDGTSLIDAPDRAPSGAGAGRRPANTFRYGGDPAGVRCPLGAHVRRANPRDALGWWTLRTDRHRIIRRGVPYQDQGERGLIFVCFNASIARQFELIQGHWLMDGDAFGLGGDRDPLLGSGDPAGKLAIQGDRRRPASFLPVPAQPLITTRGGYYLFVPGIAALRELAGAGSA